MNAASGGRIVVDDADRLRFLDELRTVVSEHGWRCGAYCVMDTHAHVLVCTPEADLGAGMKIFLGRYAFRYNRRHGLSGHLCRRRYWSRRIDRPHYLRCAALYAVLNPVAAGVCRHPSGFRWSSYRETAHPSRPSGLLNLEVVLHSLDDDLDVARALYRELVDDAVARLGRRRAEEAWWRTVERAAAETQETG